MLTAKLVGHIWSTRKADSLSGYKLMQAEIIGGGTEEGRRIIVVDNIEVNVPKTKEMLNLLETLSIKDKKVLIVMSELTENVILASRNLQNVLIMEPSELNVLDIVNADCLLANVDAIKEIEEALK